MRIWIALLALAPTSALAAGDAAKGQQVYLANCMACHGQNADGKGPAASALKPPPRDFTDKAWWVGKKDDDIKKTIKTGRPGTAMMPFPQFSDGDIDNIIAFLHTKQPK